MMRTPVALRTVPEPTEPMNEIEPPPTQREKEKHDADLADIFSTSPVESGPLPSPSSVSHPTPIRTRSKPPHVDAHDARPDAHSYADESDRPTYGFPSPKKRRADRQILSDDEDDPMTDRERGRESGDDESSTLMSGQKSDAPTMAAAEGRQQTSPSREEQGMKMMRVALL